MEQEGKGGGALDTQTDFTADDENNNQNLCPPHHRQPFTQTYIFASLIGMCMAFSGARLSTRTEVKAQTPPLTLLVHKSSFVSQTSVTF